MKPPTLALCIPAYEAAWCLPRLLASAHAQEIPFDEILVYNDCSPDETERVAQEHGATVVTGEVNIGCSAGKNALLAHAKSEWIHFHDADDLLLENFTRLAQQWMAKGVQCPDTVLFDYEYRDDDTNELIAASDFSPTLLQSDPLRYAILNQINPFCGLYRRSKLIEVGGYDTDPEILYNEDVAFHCKLAASGLTFSAEKEVSIVNYRVSGSMSGANQVRCLKAHHEVMRRLAVTVGDRYADEIAQRLWAVATGLCAYSEWGEADRALELATRLSPGIPDQQGRLFGCLCKILGARCGFRLREALIRRFKPQLRKPI